MNKLINFLMYVLRSEIGEVGGDVDPGVAPTAPVEPAPAGLNAPAPTAPPADPAAPVVPETHPIYGDLKVAWPELTSDEVQNSPAIKPFVNDKGELNVANLLNSYLHTKKSFGADKLAIPGENATDQEINDYHSKLGWVENVEDYKLESPESTNLTDDFNNALKSFAHENKIPVKQAQKMADFMESQAVEGIKMDATAQADSIKEGLDLLKAEYGSAYDHNLTLAKRVLSEVVKDESVLEAVKDPVVGTNPILIKTLVKIGQSLFKEDSFGGTSGGAGMLSPVDAQEKINSIRMDVTHAFNKPGHPNHAKATSDMLKLYDMINGA